MSTPLQPSRLPGGRRRFNARIKTTSTSAFSKSPVLNSPTSRQNFAGGSRPGTVIQPPTASTQEPTDDGDDQTEEQPENSNVAEEIRPDFLSKSGNEENIDEPGKGNNTDDVAKKETDADKSDGNDTKINDKEKEISDSSDSPNWNNNTTSKKNRIAISEIQRRKKIIGTSIVLSLAATLGALIISVPIFIANTLSDLLTGKVSSLEVNDQQRFHRKAFGGPISGLLTKDGRIGARLIADMELRGYRFEFDGAKKIKSLRAPNGTLITDPNDIGAAFGDHMDSKFKFFRSRWKTKGADALYRRFGISQDSILNPRTIDPKLTAEQQISKDIANAADAGDAEIDFNPRDPPEDATDEDIENLNGEEKDRASFAEKSDIYEDPGEWLKEGKDPKEFPNQTLMQSFLDPEVNSADIDLIKQIKEGTNGLPEVAGFANKLFNSADIFGKLCTLNKALKGAVLAARVYRSLALANAAFRYISADDAVRKGEASSDLMRELFKRVVGSDASGRYFGAGAGYSLATAGVFSKLANDERRSAYGVDGKTTGAQKLMQDTTDFIPGCALWVNPYVNAGIIVGEIALTIVSFGGAKAVTKAGSEAITTLIEQGVAKSMAKIITSKITRGFATGAVIDIGFDTAIQLTKLQTEKTLVGSLSVSQSRGGLLSDQITTGAGALSAVQAAQAGLPVASPDQFVAATKQYYAQKKENLKKQSIYTRLFDMNNLDSLAFNTVSNFAFNGHADPSNIGNTLSNLATMPNRIFSGLAGSLTPGASAEDEDLVTHDVYVTDGDNPGVEIATNHAGTPRRVLTPEVERYINMQNVEYLIRTGDVESPAEGEYNVIAGSDLDNFMKVCVDPIEVITAIETNEDCMAEKEISQRFYAFVGLQNSLDNYLGSYENPEDISSGGESVISDNRQSSPTSTNIANLNGPVMPCTGQPRTIKPGPFDSADWTGITPTGTIGTNIKGEPMYVYVREACSQTNVKTVVIAASIHGSENGGQQVAQELLFNAKLPPEVRVVAIPKICACAGTGNRSANNIDLNRNYDYRWRELPSTQTFDSGKTYSKGAAPESEPETKAMTSFLNSLGTVEFFAVYHDVLNYVAPVGNTPLNMAQIYAETTNMRVGNSKGTYVNQAGSLDGWYNQSSGSPAILVELGYNQSSSVIKSHAEAVVNVLESIK